MSPVDNVPVRRTEGYIDYDGVRAFPVDSHDRQPYDIEWRNALDTGESIITSDWESRGPTLTAVEQTTTAVNVTDGSGTSLDSSNPTFNNGGLVTFATAPVLLQFDLAALAGYTPKSLRLWARVNIGFAAAKVQAIADGNTWDAGSSSGAAEVGAACYNFARYDSFTPDAVDWVGAAGLTAGTDYGTDGPTLAFADYNGRSGVYSPIDLPLAWIQDWMSGARENNGLVLTGDPANPWQVALFLFSLGNPPYLAVEVVDGSKTSIIATGSGDIVNTVLTSSGRTLTRKIRLIALDGSLLSDYRLR